jgi:hypothetical protein
VPARAASSLLTVSCALATAAGACARFAAIAAGEAVVAVEFEPLEFDELDPFEVVAPVRVDGAVEPADPVAPCALDPAWEPADPVLLAPVGVPLVPVALPLPGVAEPEPVESPVVVPVAPVAPARPLAPLAPVGPL